MAPSTPFIDRETGSIDTEQILEEAEPLAKLIGLVVAIALVPLALAVLLGSSGLAAVVAIVAQFVLAVGSGIVLMYVIVRAIHLADLGAE